MRGYVAEGSELDPSCVIPGQAAGPAPKDAYATVILIDETADGFEWTSEAPGGTDAAPAVDQTAYESVNVSWSVQFFRKGARDYARTFRFWAQSPQGAAAAAKHGLTFYRTSGVRQLDEVVSEAWEERAGLDLYLGYVATAAPVDVGRAETFEVPVNPLTIDPITGEEFIAQVDEAPPCNS